MKVLLFSASIALVVVVVEVAVIVAAMTPTTKRNWGLYILPKCISGIKWEDSGFRLERPRE
jgi:hypothetical protein